MKVEADAMLTTNMQIKALFFPFLFTHENDNRGMYVSQ